jgi:hypothetical protein
MLRKWQPRRFENWFAFHKMSYTIFTKSLQIRDTMFLHTGVEEKVHATSKVLLNFHFAQNMWCLWTCREFSQISRFEVNLRISLRGKVFHTIVPQHVRTLWPKMYVRKLTNILRYWYKLILACKKKYFYEIFIKNILKTH